MKKTKKQAKLYKIALSSLTIAATIGTSASIGVNTVMNKNSKNVESKLMDKISNSKSGESQEHSSLVEDKDQETDHSFSEEASDWPTPSGTAVDPDKTPWYDTSGKTKYYLKKGTTIADKEFVTDPKDATGPSEYKYNGVAFTPPKALLTGNPGDKDKWGWKLHAGTSNYVGSTFVATPNPTDGAGQQTVFIDSKGTAWTSAKGKALYYRLADETSWQVAKGFRISDGAFAKIIEDDAGTLWANVDGGTLIQYKKADEDDWHLADSSCRIEGTQHGILFKETIGNVGRIWAAGKKSGLQYKDPDSDTWHDADPTCGIADGTNGMMIQGKDGTLWAMAKRSGLWYKKPGKDTWYKAGSECKVVDGDLGYIYEDASSRIWAMGRGSSPQYTEDGGATWKDVDPTCTVADGYGGVILEDSLGTIWIEAKGSSMFLKQKGSTAWEHYANHFDGEGGNIFEDSSGTLWSYDAAVAPFNMKLDPSLLGRIVSGPTWGNPHPQYGQAFSAAKYAQFVEDKLRGRVWVAGAGLARPASVGSLGYFQAIFTDRYWTQTFDGEEIPEVKWVADINHTIDKPPKGMHPKITYDAPEPIDLMNVMGHMEIDGKPYEHKKEPVEFTSKASSGGPDGEITITNFDPRSTLQYKSITDPNWHPVPPDGVVKGLSKGIYQLQAIPKDASSSFVKETISDDIVIPIVKGQSKPGEIDGEIQFPNAPLNIKLQYQKPEETTWTDVPAGGIVSGLGLGEYKLRGVDSGNNIIDYDKTPIVIKGDLTIKIVTPNFDGTEKGKIKIGNVDPRAEVKWQKYGTGIWNKVPANGIIAGLDVGSYKLKLVPKVKDNGFEEQILDNFINIPDWSEIPTSTSVNQTKAGAKDGQIKLVGNPSYIKLEYQKEGDTDWHPVPPNGIVPGLELGPYKIRGRDTTCIENQDIIEYPDSVFVGGNPTVVVTAPTADGASDGEIKVDDIDPRAKIQYQKVGQIGWKDAPSSGTISGLDDGWYKLRMVSKTGATSKFLTTELPDLYKVGNAYIRVDQIWYVPKDVTGFGKADGSITIHNFWNADAKLQYRKIDKTTDPDGPWTGTDIPTPANPSDDFVELGGLEPGEYEFRWVPINGGLFKDDKETYWSDTITIKSNIEPPKAVPTFTITPATADDKASVQANNYKNPGSVLQYSKDGIDWVDVPNDGNISGLDSVSLQFRWQVEEGSSYSATTYDPSGLNVVVNAGDTTINAGTTTDAKIIDIPAKLKITTVSATAIGNDGRVSVDVISTPDATLQFSIDGGINWDDVDASKEIGGLSDEKVSFKWVLKDPTAIFTDGRTEIPAGSSAILTPNIKPVYTSIAPTIKDGSDGSIHVENPVFDNSKLQYSIDRLNWHDVTITVDTSGNPVGDVTGLEAGEIFFRWTPKLEGDTYTDDKVSIHAGSKVVDPSTHIMDSELTCETKAPTYAGNNDGEISITNFAKPNWVLQYQKEGVATWTDVPSNGKVIGTAKIYEFRWHLVGGLTFANGLPNKFAGSYRIPKSSVALVPTTALTINPKPETFKGANDGAFTIAKFNEEFSKLQYSLDGGKTWNELPKPDVVSGNIEVKNVPNGDVDFQWVPKDGFSYQTGAVVPPVASITIVASTKIKAPADPKLKGKDISNKNAPDGEIEITAETNANVELQYKLTSDLKWDTATLTPDTVDPTLSAELLKNLSAGEYEFRWKALNGGKFTNGQETSPITETIIISATNIIASPSNPSIVPKPVDSFGAKDGSITSDIIDDGTSKLQYKLNTEPDSSWQDVQAGTTGGLIENLKAGTYNFRWVPIAGADVYSDTTRSVSLPDVTVDDSDVILTPKDPSFVPNAISTKGKSDGSIDITDYEDINSKLQFSLDGGTTWEDVALGTTTSGIEIVSNNADELTINGLPAGDVKFQWVPSTLNKKYKDGSIKQTLSDVKIDDSMSVEVPTAIPTFTTTSATVAGSDGSVVATPFKDGAATLQYSTDEGANWTLMTSDTITGLDKGKVLFQWLAGTSGETFENGQSVIDAGESQLFVPLLPTFDTTDPTTMTSKDGFVTVTSTMPANVKLQYKLKTAPNAAWRDANGNKAEKLDSGEYVFQWVGENGETFANGLKAIDAGSATLKESKIIALNSIQFIATAPTAKGLPDGKIEIKNFIKDEAHLEYKDANGKWDKIPKNGVIIDLLAGAYEFKWVADNGKTFDGTNTEISAGIEYVPESAIISSPTIVPGITHTDPTITNAGDGTISITDAADRYSKLQYTTDAITGSEQWHDVDLTGTAGLIDNLAPGDVHFQWVPRYTGDEYPGNSVAEPLMHVETIDESQYVERPTAVPRFQFSPLSGPTATDGSIEIKDLIDPYSTLQYTTDVLDGSEKWNDIPSSNIIGPQGKATVHFRWLTKNGKIYVDDGSGASDTTISLADKRIDVIRRIDTPVKPRFDVTPSLNGNDGTIQVTGNQNIDSSLEYLTSGGVWKPVDPSGLIEKLAPGDVQFRWVGINGEEYKDKDTSGNHLKEIPAGKVTVSDKATIAEPPRPDFHVIPLQTAGSATGKIEIKDFVSPDAKLEFTINGGSTWEEVTPGTTGSGIVITSASPDEATITGLSKGIVSFRWTTNKGLFSNGTDEIHIVDKDINDSKQIIAPTAKLVYTTTDATGGIPNGIVTINIVEDGASKLQYTLDPTIPNSWKDVDSTTKEIDSLSSDAIVHFQWIPKKPGDTYIGGDTSIDAGINGIQIPGTLNFTPSEPSTIGGNDGEVQITGDVSNPNAILQYKLATKNFWKSVDTTTSKVSGFEGGDVVQFRWIGKNGEIFTNQKTEVDLQDQTIDTSSNIVIEQTIFHTFGVSTQGMADGHIEITNYINPNSKLQYKLIGVSGSTWEYVSVDPLDPTKGLVDHLPAGNVDFRWFANAGKTFDNGKTEMPVTRQHVSDSKFISVPSVTPIITSDSPSSKGGDDGTVTVLNFIDKYSKLQYVAYDANGLPIWKDVPTSGIIKKGLTPGDILRFRWVGKNGQTYASNNKLEIIVKDATLVPDSINIAIPTVSPTFTVAAAVVNGKDGEVKVTDNIDPTGNSILQYFDGTSWINVPTSGDITGLDTISLNFKWVPKNKGDEYPGNAIKEPAGTTRIDAPKVSATYDPTSPSIKGQADGSIKVFDFLDTDAKLQYKLSTDSKWKPVLANPTNPSQGLIETLSPGTYEFQWVGKLGQEFTDTSVATPAGNVDVDVSNFVPVPTNPTIIPVTPTYIGATDGELKISDITDANSILKYRKDGDTTWTEVPADPLDPTKGLIKGLPEGDSYEFQWVANGGAHYVGTTLPEITIGMYTIPNASGIQIPPTSPSFTPTSPSLKGLSDGSIEVIDFENTYSVLQYRLMANGIGQWKDVPASPLDPTKGLIGKLPVGTYEFQWVGKNGEDYTDGTNAQPIIDHATIKETAHIKVPQDPVVTIKSLSAVGSTDGEIHVDPCVDTYSTLQYKLSTETDADWKDLPMNGLDVTGLGITTYNFRWTPKDALNDYLIDGKVEKTAPVADRIIDDSVLIDIPVPPILTPISPTTSIATDGTIEIKDFKDPTGKAMLEYIQNGATSMVTGDITGLAVGDTIEFKWVLIDPKNRFTNGSREAQVDIITIKDSMKIPEPSVKPTFTWTDATANGDDGSIGITDYLDQFSELRFRKATSSNTGTWEIVTADTIAGLSAGVYQFEWTPKFGVYTDGTTERVLIDKVLIGGPGSFTTSPVNTNPVNTNPVNTNPVNTNPVNTNPVNTNPTLPVQAPTDTVDPLQVTVSSPSNDGYKDGSIKLPESPSPDVKTQYLLDDGTWRDVPTDGEIKDLAPGIVELQYVPANGGNFADGSSSVKAGTIVVSPTDNIGLSANTDENGIQNISADKCLDPSGKSELQYLDTSVTPNVWTNVPTDGIIKDNDDKQISLRWHSTVPGAIAPEREISHIVTRTQDSIFESGHNNEVDSTISSAKVEYIQNMYHDFAIFRVSRLGNDVSELSYIDYQDSKPKLVNSIQEATNSAPNEHITKLNMADHSTIYYVETVEDGKQVVYIQEIDDQGNWLSSVMAVKTGENTFDMYSESDADLAAVKSLYSEWEEGYIFDTIAELPASASSSADEPYLDMDISGIYGSTSLEDDPSVSTESVAGLSAEGMHVWNKHPRSIHPIRAEVVRNDDTISVKYNNKDVQLFGSSLSGLSSTIDIPNLKSMDDKSSSFPWWTLSFASIPIFGIIWILYYRNKKSKKE